MRQHEPPMLGAVSPEQAPVLTGYDRSPGTVRPDPGEEALSTLFIDMGGPFRAEPPDAGSGMSRDILSYREIAGIIGQAWDLGLQSAVFENIAAPDLHPQLRGIISQVHSLNVIPVVRIDARAVTGEFAGFLRDRNASVLALVRPPDHLSPADTERFLGRMLRNLTAAGFGAMEERRAPHLAVAWADGTVSPEVLTAFWDFCRRRNMIPMMEPSAGFRLPETDGASVFSRLRELDRSRYGYIWPDGALSGVPGCRAAYSLSVTGGGNVLPCGGMAFDGNPAFLQDGVYPYNIRIRSLGEIYGDPSFRRARMAGGRLEGIPGTRMCPDACIGCGGATCVDAGRNAAVQPWRPVPDGEHV